jgi:hypothetical protein
MTHDQTRLPPIVPSDVLAGVGGLSRKELCGLIVLLESVDGMALVKGAVEGMADKVGLGRSLSGKDLAATSDALEREVISEAVLRYRLWVRIAEALVIPDLPPLSSRSATQAASALAVRASERLTPSILARRRAEKEPARAGAMRGLAGRKAADAWNAAKRLTKSDETLPFPEVVAEELLHLLADEEFVAEAVCQADPEIAASLEKGRRAATKAIAAGGGWVAFAAIVGNAGFLPYILAAQLSAWVPLVGGPALVSLLATLINPLTVFVGVGALGWVGLGKGSNVVRSQIAARLCALLAISGSREREYHLARFLGDIRSLDRADTAQFRFLSKAKRRNLLLRLASISGRLDGPLPPPAGSAPGAWNSKIPISDALDAATVGALTAGEMLWQAVAIDENVLKSADFSRAADLDNPIAFALNAHSFLAPGAAYSLRGYVAERLVMNQLIADGHDVALAEASNTPGLDLIVNGQPVQVKCGMELSNLTEHFEKYPDIPVIANKELANMAASSGEKWSHLITTLPGFEIKPIEERIEDALGHAADLSNPDLLEIALSVGLLRGGLELAQGRVPIGDLPAWLLLDGASRGALGVAGGTAGSWVGLVAIGPAGALVLGPVMACALLVGNGAVKNGVQRILMSEWIEEALRLAGALHSSLVAATETLLHKSAEGRHSPFPRQSYPAASVTGMPSAVKPFRTAMRT